MRPHAASSEYSRMEQQDSTSTQPEGTSSSASLQGSANSPQLPLACEQTSQPPTRGHQASSCEDAERAVLLHDPAACGGPQTAGTASQDNVPSADDAQHQAVVLLGLQGQSHDLERCALGC